MSVVSTSTKHLAQTDSIISLSFTTPVTTSTIVTPSVFESASSRSSQATFASSGTLTPHSLTTVSLKSEVLSGSIPFASTLASSHSKSSGPITTSQSLHTTTASSQITIAPNATVSFTEKALQTSFSTSESAYSSQIEVPSGLTTSNTLSSTSPPTLSHATSVSQTTPATTSDFTSSNNETTSHTTSSDSSSINQTSTITFTPSASSSLTSDLSPPYIHSPIIHETGEDTTLPITSSYTDLNPNTSGQETHNSASPNTAVSTQSPISGVAMDTSSGSFWPIQETPIQWPSQPSDVITSPPTMNIPSSPTELSNDGLTSLSPISVDLGTSAFQDGSLTPLESELSTSTPFVRLRNTVQDDGYTIYATTFTSLKTFFTIATITASPTPTIVITSTPYLTKMEVITTTFVARDSADFVTATIIVPASKAGSAFRLSKAQIGGIIAGAVGLFAFLAAILIYLILQKRRRNFVLVPANNIPFPESDPETGEDGSSRNFRQSIVQVPACTSGSDPVILPPSGQVCHNTPQVSSLPSTVSYQHPSHTGAIDTTSNLTTAHVRTSSADMNRHSDEGHSAESSSYLTAQTVSTESLASESPDLSVDPLPRRMSQSSRMAYEKEIERLRQEVLSQADRIRYLDEEIDLMDPRSPPPPSYRSSRRSAISTQASRSSLSLPPPLPSHEISH
ncbi:hypothetical protein F5146DRAFT_1137343 [Armillaria mellea]|nr:hypothetical protein F5146DRAFT_1137343 [Armillaria mellea]